MKIHQNAGRLAERNPEHKSTVNKYIEFLRGPEVEPFKTGIRS